MSFRLRVLLLVVLVAVTATVATGWLTLRQASQQFSDSAAVDQSQLALISDRLRDYGEQHGTWEGVAGLIQDLHGQTGQRIHLVSESGIVIVDTDTLRRQDARPLGSASSLLDPRPQISLSGATGNVAQAVIDAIINYRREVRVAACLTRNGLGVAASPDSLGLPRFAPSADALTFAAGSVDNCERAEVTGGERNAAILRVASCGQEPPTAPTQDIPPQPGRSPPVENPWLDCLARAFTEQISDVAPVPAVVYLGARGDPAFTLAVGPLLAAAAGMALVVIVGTVLLSHRVLRPIGILTAAAHRLGQGDLDSRVPVHGNDELAELGRSFNRMAESLRRGEERQRRLVADVAHELRTPLANLRGYLEALSDGVIRPSPELFASLHEEAVLQQRIVDDLQDLALAEAGNLAYHRVEVDLADLLETCHVAHRALAESAGVALTLPHHPPLRADPRPADGSSPLVYADPDRLRQTMGNLITNALRATPSGGTVSLRLDQDGPCARIQVVDTGIGIESAALPHIFDRFWRADQARGRHTGGGGLGLAIVRQIITDHGGTISVTSEVGVGTTFTIRLPEIGHPAGR